MALFSSAGISLHASSEKTDLELCCPRAGMIRPAHVSFLVSNELKNCFRLNENCSHRQAKPHTSALAFWIGLGHHIGQLQDSLT